MRPTIAVLCMIVSGCNGASAPSYPVASNATKEKPMSHAAELSRKLVADAYGDFVYFPDRDEAIQKIWDEPGNPAALEALIDDTGVPAKVRFIAAEVLFARDFSFVSRHGASVVASIYAKALQGKVTGHLNAWGLLWYDDTAGESGDHLVALGKDAIPALRELLEDRTVLRGYLGSEEATIGNGARYRVRDFAAYYLSRILYKPMSLPNELPMNIDFATRDAEIEKLVAGLPAD